MPDTVIEGLVEVVDDDLRHVLGDDLNLDPGVLHEELDVTLGAEPVIDQHTGLLEGSELE